MSGGERLSLLKDEKGNPFPHAGDGLHTHKFGVKINDEGPCLSGTSTNLLSGSSVSKKTISLFLHNHVGGIAAGSKVTVRYTRRGRVCSNSTRAGNGVIAAGSGVPMESFGYTSVTLTPKNNPPPPPPPPDDDEDEEEGDEQPESPGSGNPPPNPPPSGGGGNSDGGDEDEGSDGGTSLPSGRQDIGEGEVLCESVFTQRWIPSTNREAYLLIEAYLTTETGFEQTVNPNVVLYTMTPRPEGHVPEFFIDRKVGHARIQAEGVSESGPVEIDGSEYYLTHYRTAPKLRPFLGTTSLGQARTSVYVDEWEFRLQRPLGQPPDTKRCLDSE